MKWGDFRSLFRGIAWKRLTPHEVDPSVSNGHEFQGVGKLRSLIGTEKRDRLPTTYVLLHDDNEPDVLELWSSWYDARANDPTRSAEWRLYYPAEAGAIQAKMAAGDLLVVAVTQQENLLVLLARSGSDRERELEVLFGIREDSNEKLQVRSFDAPLDIDFTTVVLLEQLGLSLPALPVGDGADVVREIVDLLETDHSEKLPSGRIIATMVRDNVPRVSALEEPDAALTTWIETEAAVYRGWEDRKIARRLLEGFVHLDGTADVDAFRTFSMALRQSRVSRAGGALQYHMETLLREWAIPYVMEPTIDGGESPDFLFPSAKAYTDASFPAANLRMLAAKYTAKDRWRQVLNEAERIPQKHLLTLEPAISKGQLSLMQRASLTPVIPAPIRNKYADDARGGILTVQGFIDELRSVQTQWS